MKEADSERALARFLRSPTRFRFFTGKGVVGKTSLVGVGFYLLTGF